MKYLILSVLSLVSYSSHSFAWKQIAISIDCPILISIEAQEGIEHVIATINDERFQLNNLDEAKYSENSMSSFIFINEIEKMQFILPGKIEANPPKFKMYNGENEFMCRMNLI